MYKKYLGIFKALPLVQRFQVVLAVLCARLTWFLFALLLCVQNSVSAQSTISSSKASSNSSVAHSPVHSVRHLPHEANASDYLRFKSLANESLKSIGAVYAIVQDRQGFMWFGGENGLARYDAYQLKIYRHDGGDPGSLSSSYVKALLMDSYGQLWVGTQSGLNRYDPVSETFIHYRHSPSDLSSLSSDNISDLLEDQFGHLWVATWGGLNRLLADGVQFERHLREVTKQSATRFVEHAHIAPENRINALFEDHHGVLWVASENGLMRREPGSDNFSYYFSEPGNEHSLSSSNTSAVYEDVHGQLWVGTYAGLNRFERNSDRFVRYMSDAKDDNSRAQDFVQVLTGDITGNLWVASDSGGLDIFDQEKQKFLHYKHHVDDAGSLAGDKVRSLYRDRQGGIWLGYFPGGVGRVDWDASAFRRFRHRAGNFGDNSLLDSSILSVAEDYRGKLWVGTEKGLNVIDLNASDAGLVEPFIQANQDEVEIGDSPVLSLTEGREGVVWAGTWYQGLFRIDTQTGIAQRYLHDEEREGKLNNGAIWSLMHDSAGALWVGTGYGGLYRFDAQSQQFQRFQNTGDDVITGDVYAIYEDSAKRFWIGSGNGLYQLNRGQQSFKYYPRGESSMHSLANSGVRVIKEDRDGFLWLGTLGSGVSRFNPEGGEFRTYQVKHGLADNVVTGIVEDHKGVMWFATANGVSRFNPETETFQNYSQKSGLAGNLHNRSAYALTSRGQVVFGSTEGLTVFHSDDIVDNTHAPPIVITDFLVLNKSVVPGAEGSPLNRSIDQVSALALNYKQSVFSFEFTALNYRMPEKNQYAYRLKGFDRDWNYVGNRRMATYTNLDPGKYVFQVKGSNNEGVWNEVGTEIEIKILAPWWASVWAYFMYFILLLVLIAWFIYTQRQKVAYQIERTEQAREKAEQERLLTQRLRQVDKLKDEFLANTSHELRTPLHGMIGLAESLVDGAAGDVPDNVKYNLEMIVSSGKRLGSLVNDILDFSKLKNQSLTLQKRPIDLCSIVDVVLILCKPLVASKSLQLINAVDSEFPRVNADENRLQQVLYNLIGNGVKFTDKGSVTISAELCDGSSGQYVRVQVKDTGIGIPDHAQTGIFNSFQQVEGSERRSYGGSGLGLAVSKQLIELHGGEISLSSVLDEGSTFCFTLPMTSSPRGLSINDSLINQSIENNLTAHAVVFDNMDVNEFTVDTEKQALSLGFEAAKNIVPTENMAPSAGLSPNTDASNLHILVVDDEPVNRQVLLNHLGVLHYQVSVASSGAEALALFDNLTEGQGFDLILLDVMMPRMSGFEVCASLRERYPAQELPVIFLTAKNQVTDMVIGFDVGANDFISKPVAKEELIARVKLHLQLLEVNRNLEKKVKQRTQDLLEKNKQLETTQSQLMHSEKMASLATLVAGIAHEINNPTNMTNASVFNLDRELTRLQNFIAELIHDDVDPEIGEAFNQRFDVLFGSLDIMRDGTTRIIRLVEGLRLFSSLDDTEYQKINLGSVLYTCQVVVQASYSEQIDFKLEVDPQLEVYCYRAPFNQAIINIMVNGCQAIVAQYEDDESAKSGVLSVDVKQVDDEIDASGQNRWLCICISDTGCGMSAESRQRIFEPFYTTRKVGEGIGLGSSMAYGVIEQHKGRIEVESELGEGTLIRVYLPLNL